MKLGALNHIADVGIATNLAFGILDTYRSGIRNRISKRVAETLASLRTATMELGGTNGTEPAEEITAIEQQVLSMSEAWQRRFVCLAIAAAGLLALFLLCAAVHEDSPCSREWTWAIVLLLMGIIPIAASWITMWAFGEHAEGKLMKIGAKYKDAVDTAKKLKTASLKPTDPGPSPSP